MYDFAGFYTLTAQDTSLKTIKEKIFTIHSRMNNQTQQLGLVYASSSLLLNNLPLNPKYKITPLVICPTHLLVSFILKNYIENYLFLYN